MAFAVCAAMAGHAFADELDATVSFEKDKNGNTIPAGTILTEVYADSTSGPVGPIGITARVWNDATTDYGLIFDSANPPGVDYDLGTPNEDFGGPGIGTGGESGAAHENTEAQGNIIVWAQDFTDSNGDGLVDTPNDRDEYGMTMVFDFTGISSPSSASTVTVYQMTMIDVQVDEGEAPATVKFFDSDGDQIGSTFSQGDLGDNGVGVLSFGANGVSGVATMKVEFQGSGGFDDIKFSVDVEKADPSIDIRKQAEGADTRLVDIGDDVEFTIVVTNTGNVDLVDVEVTDEMFPDCGKYIGDLAAGASYSYTCTVENVVEGFTNIACVEGTYEGTDPDTVVDDCDPSTVIPRINCCIKGLPKPQEITFIYRGGNCDATDNSQASDKQDCKDYNGGPDGAATVTICITDKENRDLFSDDVDLNDSFIVYAQKEDKNGLKKFESDMFYTIKDASSGDVLQEGKLHTSCSQPLIIGDIFGSLEFYGTDGPCRATCCDGTSKPIVLTFRYTGGDCDDSDNYQATDKAKCEGDAEDTATVHILVGDNDNFDGGTRIYFDGNVNLNDTFDVKASNANEDKFENQTYYEIRTTGGTVLMSGTFHTSCSQPLLLGDTYGALHLEGCSDGTDGGGGGGGTSLCGTAKVSKITFIYTGDQCTATSNTQASDKQYCNDYNGGPNGASVVTIVITDKNNADLFSDDVNLNDSFQVVGQKDNKDKLDKFEADMFYTIKNATTGAVLQEGKLHTSCSQPLNIGDQFGALEVKSGVNENGDTVE